MAEALFTDLLGKLISILQREVVKEVRLLVGVEDDIKKLSKTLATVKAVLEDAEKKQVTDKSVELWLQNLKEVAYDMEDLVEEWIIKSTNNDITIAQEVEEEAQPDRPIKDKLLRSLSSPCSCFKPVVVRHGVGRKIEALRTQLELLVKEKNKFKLVKSSGLKEPDRNAFLTTSIIDVSKIYGRNHDKDFIISKLLRMSPNEGSFDDKRGIPVIAVVGTGGMGKTALAQFAYNDHQVQTYFEKTIWVCVSDPFDKARIAKEITGETHDRHIVSDWNDRLHCSLRDIVMDKRFLLVLDDVWTEEYTDWEPLKVALDYGARGSWILVTTRSNLTASAMRASFTHNIEELAEPDCWALFSSIAFADRDIKDCEKAEWEDVGRKIVKKCKGVPLSVKAVAGVLVFKKALKEWEGILESDIWQEQTIEHKVLPSLLFSYYALSPNLKRCFTYCAVFPKDTILKKDKLVKSWMAHDYINIEGGAQDECERIGQEYFDHLAMRSFFQDIEIDEHKSIVSAKMHDLVHDLAQLLTRNESLLLEDGSISSFDMRKIRHLSTWHSLEDGNSIFSTISEAKKLRTLKLTVKLKDNIIPSISKCESSFGDAGKLFANVMWLRALDMSGCYFVRLPDEIGNLIQLRYLNLSYSNYLVELPETLKNLCNLQTLMLNNSSICKLPEGMKNMTSLRYLEIDGTYRVDFLPQGLGQLSNLRTLSKFIVGGGSTINTGCKLSDLKDLNLLHGKLEIRGLGKVRNINEAIEANLKGKKHLSTVKLDFANYSYEHLLNDDDIERQNGVLESLQIHENVKKVDIYSYYGSRLPFWMTSYKLKRLSIRNCKNCKHLPALGKLKMLENLILIGLDTVKFIDEEFLGIDGRSSLETSFPMLKKLHVSHMASLEAWDFPDGSLKFMPQLCELSLMWCPELKTLPPLGKLRSLEILELKALDSIKLIGTELLGNNNDSISAFPKLKSLHLSFLKWWKEWELPVVQNPELVMPCLQELVILYCSNLRRLPALGKLKMLEKLEMEALDSVNCIGLEFWGVSNVLDKDDVIVFPELKHLKIMQMQVLKVWEFPEVLGKNVEIMPSLRELSIRGCDMLKALPALGRLKSLEKLDITNAHSVKYIGLEFFGTQEPNKIVEAFPKLISLSFDGMRNLEEWVLPEAEEDMVAMMPCLTELKISGLRKLSVLPPLWKLESLELLEISFMDAIKRVGLEFFGISGADCKKKIGVNDKELISIVAFPKLKELKFNDTYDWEEWKLSSVPTEEDEEEDISITFPCLNLLLINYCPKLKVIPRNISSCKPWKLKIVKCPKLTPTCIPTQGVGNLEEIDMKKEEDFFNHSYNI